MVTTLRQSDTHARTRPGFVDCDLHNELDSDKDLHPYLSKRWLDHLLTYGTRKPAGGMYPRFLGHRQDAQPPSGRLSGSEVAFTRSNFLDKWGCAYGILNPLSPAGSQQNPEFDAALATAVNDWQVAEWLDPEPRLRASIILPFEHADLAIAEIERRSTDKRFVQVQFSGRPHEPMGRRKYWPIYEACSKYGLVVMSHAFGSFGQPITGAGWPSFYLEEHVGPAQAMQANLTSMVIEGVFDRFPTLKVVSAENGFGWLPSLAWRLDNTYALLKSEVPHLKRLPSEYLHEHVYLCTQPIEEPHKQHYFNELLEQFGNVDRLVFATDYPHWDWDSPDLAFPVQLAPDVQQKIYFDNAAALYGLS